MVDEPAVEPAVEPAPESPVPGAWLKEQGLDSYYDKLKKFDSVAAMGKGYVNLEQSYGKSVKIPEEGDVDGFNELYTKLGRPETEDKYEIEAVEGFDMTGEVMTAVKSAAHMQGLNPKQLNGVAGAYMRGVKAQQEAAQKEIDAKNAERWANYKVEWGETKTAENIELAKRVIRDAPELEGIITEEMVESDPLFVSLMSRLMRKSMDDTLVTGGQGGEDDYRPQYPDSPEMYAAGESEDSKKARAWFIKRGHKYG
jgi:hypothetical protein